MERLVERVRCAHALCDCRGAIAIIFNMGDPVNVPPHDVISKYSKTTVSLLQALNPLEKPTTIYSSKPQQPATLYQTRRDLVCTLVPFSEADPQ
jgi:hypothetical protein